MKLEKTDKTHVKFHLGRTAVVLDIPSADQAKYNPDAEVPAPDVDLKLDWVYGYRGNDCRNNLVFAESTKEVVYFMAAVVVLYNPIEKEQRHYTEHTDDIKSIALHPDGRILATGQVAGHSKKDGKPHVRIWTADDLQTLHVIGEEGGVFNRAVCCLAFSVCDGGNRLCAIDEHDDHLLSVWYWSKEEKLAEVKSSKDTVLDVEFNPLEPSKIVSCGRGQISFWTITDENRLERKRGTFKTNEAPKFILGLAFSPKGFLASGDSDGNIHIWDKGHPKLTRTLKNAHEDAVFSVTFLPDGRLVSGGRAGHIVMWDAAANRKLVDTKLSDTQGAVRCITAVEGDKVLIGSTKNCLLEGSFASGFTPIIYGHRDEVWGLTPHRSKTKFITCGDDRTIYLVDAEIRYPVWISTVKQAGHCVALSSNVEHTVAIGTQTGHCIILDGKDGHEMTKIKISREQIECIQFSPDGDLLAIGSRDNDIYLFEFNGKKLVKKGECKGHTSFVTHIDWSADGKLLRSNSGDYELLFWKMPDCDREYSDDVTRDAEWDSATCTLDFNACGIWSEANDGSDVNACAMNKEKTLIASGDDFGSVNLYRYPCSTSKAKKKVGRSHSSHVTNVQFLSEKLLITAGGKDMAIMQWKLK